MGITVRARESQFQDLVVVAVRIDFVEQLGQEFTAVTGQEINSTDPTFLQAFVWIQGMAQRFGVTRDKFALERFGACRRSS